jgi:hypothetical protein
MMIRSQAMVSLTDDQEHFQKDRGRGRPPIGQSEEELEAYGAAHSSLRPWLRSQHDVTPRGP